MEMQVKVNKPGCIMCFRVSSLSMERGKSGPFLERKVPQSLTLRIYYSFTVFGVCASTRGRSPLSVFCARCFREEHSKLNFNRFALAFTRLACPWVENHPLPCKLRAQHLPTTEAFIFPFTAPSILAASSYSEASQ